MEVNLCGANELIGTQSEYGTPVGPKAAPSPPPQSPLKLTIAASELHTPQTSRREDYVTATPSPALLNPLPKEYWHDALTNRPILCPRLDSRLESRVQQLQAGFAVKLFDVSRDAYELVEISLSRDKSYLNVTKTCMHIGNASYLELEDETKNQEGETGSRYLHSIGMKDIVQVGQETDVKLQNQRILDSGHPLKCFSVATTEANHFFECNTVQQREAIVSTLLAMTKRQGKAMLRMRSSAIMPLAEPSIPRVNIDNSNEHPEAILSPMNRTRIFERTGSSDEDGQELSLNYSDDEDIAQESEVPKKGLQRGNSPNSPFSFAEVLGQKSSDDEDIMLEQANSVVTIALSETLEEWCTNSACTIDLTDLSESLNGLFYLAASRNRKDSLAAAKVDVSTHRSDHVRANSIDLQLKASCMNDFLNAPATIWGEGSTTSGEDRRLKNICRRARIQNRACSPTDQTHRWRQLCMEMTFDSVAHNAQTKMAVISTVKSMDDLDKPVRDVMKSSSRTSQGLFDNIFAQPVIVAAPSVITDDDCCYYDSDPGDSRIRRRRGGPRRVVAETLNKCDSPKVETASRLNFSIRQTMMKGTRFVESETIQIIEIMKSEQIPLLWHPTPTQKQPNRAPQCVSAWVEKGAYLMNQSFVQPKWMWKPAHEINLNMRRLNIASEAPKQVDLLDIGRVRDLPAFDRQRYPFAHRRRCFTVETHTEVHLFEAQSVREKKRIVFGLKLTITRLASLIITQDAKAVEEFFEPVFTPGEASRWAK